MSDIKKNRNYSKLILGVIFLIISLWPFILRLPDNFPDFLEYLTLGFWILTIILGIYFVVTGYGKRYSKNDLEVLLLGLGFVIGSYLLITYLVPIIPIEILKIIFGAICVIVFIIGFLFIIKSIIAPGE